MKCSFCGNKIEGRARIIASPEGKVRTYCSSKCLRSANLGRKGAKVKWTKTSRKKRNKE